MNKADAQGRSSRRLNLGLLLLGIWIALVSYYFLRQALDYEGLVARLAEFQFLHFDRYWPTLTFTLLTALFTAPFALILWLIRIAQKRRERERRRRLAAMRHILDRLNLLQNFFVGISVGCLLCIGIILFQMMSLPSDQLAARSIVVGSPDAITPPDGRTVLTGTIDLSETSQFNEDLILVKRTYYFAPVRAGAHDKSPLRYFVQVRRTDVKGPFNPIIFPHGDDRVHAWRYRVKNIGFKPYVDGFLKRHALPGEISNLYRYAGYKVDPDNYVLFSSSEPLKWRFQMLAGEFLIVAILATLLALLFARRQYSVWRLYQKMKKSGIESSASDKTAALT